MRIPLYSADFSADPYRVYRDMRSRFGSLVPVEIAPGVPATLVIGYRTAVRILHDPDRFPADPRIWEKTVPADSPVTPVMRWRPVASRSTASDHARYREAIIASIDAVDLFSLHSVVEQIAIPLINAFCQDGNAELISQYAFPLSFAVINAIIGCPPEIGRQVATGMAAMLDCDEAQSGYALTVRAFSELVALKRAEPGDDITTRLLHHPAKLDHTELVEQLIELYGAGIEPVQNLICNALLLMLTDDRFGGEVLGGSMLTRDALDEVLFTNPPLANLCITYPRSPVLIDEHLLPAHQPVVISLAACNNDPAISTGGDRPGNRSHLAWSAGPHACPARSMAYLAAQDAIDQLLDALPEIRLATSADYLAWRSGPFQRSLQALPVVFPPSTTTST